MLRLSLATAIGLQLARLHVADNAAGIDTMRISICPPSAAVTAGPPPLNGTWTISTPVFSLNSSPAMCDGEPTPTEP